MTFRESLEKGDHLGKYCGSLVGGDSLDYGGFGNQMKYEDLVAD